MVNDNKMIYTEQDAVVSQCGLCKHKLAGKICEAYPDGIPPQLLDNEVSHKESYPGDNGIRFEVR